MATLLAKHSESTPDTNGTRAFSFDLPGIQVTPFTPSEV